MDNKKLITIISVVALVFGLLAGVALINHRILPPRADLTPVDIVFSPPEITLFPGSSQIVNVIIEPHGQPVVIAKTVLEFDKTLLSLAEEVQTTTALKRVIRKTTAAEASTSGQIQLVLGLDPQDKATPVTAPVILATLTFSVNGTPSVDTTTQVTLPAPSIKFVNDKALVLNSNPNSLAVTVLTAAPSATPTPTQAQEAPSGVPNSCNGTCGSNANCDNAFYCYFPDPTHKPHEGFCRNPFCATASNCSCPPPTPTRLPPTRIPTRIPTIPPTSTPWPTLAEENYPFATPTTFVQIFPTAIPSLEEDTLQPQPEPQGWLGRFIFWLLNLFGGK